MCHISPAALSRRPAVASVPHSSHLQARYVMRLHEMVSGYKLLLSSAGPALPLRFASLPFAPAFAPTLCFPLRACPRGPANCHNMNKGKTRHDFTELSTTWLWDVFPNLVFDMVERIKLATHSETQAQMGVGITA